MNVSLERKTKIWIKVSFFWGFYCFYICFKNHFVFKPVKNKIRKRKQEIFKIKTVFWTFWKNRRRMFFVKSLWERGFASIQDTVSVRQVCTCAGICCLLVSWFSWDFIYLLFITWGVVLQILVKYCYLSIVIL